MFDDSLNSIREADPEESGSANEGWKDRDIITFPSRTLYFGLDVYKIQNETSAGGGWGAV